MRTHYVDIAGLTLVKERVVRYHTELEDQGLSCVVSAGWLPGMTELLPAYALAVARPMFEGIDTVTIYYGDSGEWSQNAMRDVLWFLRRYGRQRPMYRREGQWVRASLSEVLARHDIGTTVGLALFAISSLHETVELLVGPSGCSARAYAYLPNRRSVCLLRS